MCRVLDVARAGFYAWLHNPVSARDKDNQRLLTLIRDSYSLSGGVGNDSNLLIVFYVQIMPDDFVMQLHRF